MGRIWSLRHIVLDTGFEPHTHRSCAASRPVQTATSTVDGTASPTSHPDPAPRPAGVPRAAGSHPETSSGAGSVETPWGAAGWLLAAVRCRCSRGAAVSRGRSRCAHGTAGLGHRRPDHERARVARACARRHRSLPLPAPTALSPPRGACTRPPTCAAAGANPGGLRMSRPTRGASTADGDRATTQPASSPRWRGSGCLACFRKAAQEARAARRLSVRRRSAMPISEITPRRT